MTNNETPKYRSVKFTTAIVPWLLGAAMLVVYLLTTNRWVTPRSVFSTADLSNWTPGSHYIDPLIYLVTLPLRLLPSSILPLAFNIFTAICGALVIRLLARCVALLPHDRTHEQRENEHNEVALNSGRFCWLPPLFAVLLLGLERTFWESSTEATGKIVNALAFAYCVRCLLEYRIDGDEKWFSKFAVVCGMATTSNWLLTGFFPLFVIAVIWIKGLAAFESGFIRRMLLWGFVGLLLILLYPVINWHLNHNSGKVFWETLKGQVLVIKSTLMYMPRPTLLLLSLTSILPVFIMGIKWSSYFGDNSPFGIFVATSMIHIIHAMFFFAGIWVALGGKISPRILMPGAGDYFLPLSFLGALSVGYFMAYFQIVFGQYGGKVGMAFEPILKVVFPAIIVLLWLVAILVPALMIKRNWPFIQERNQVYRKFETYASLIAKTLPNKESVVLSDDPFRLLYLRFQMGKNQEPVKHMFIDTGSLPVNENIEKYQQLYPNFGIQSDWTNVPPGSSLVLMPVQVLQHLQEKHDLWYIHGSFGYYFEVFYAEQHGLTYKLMPFPAGTWDAPHPSEELIAENAAFWGNAYDTSLIPSMTGYVRKDATYRPTNIWEKLDKSLKLTPEPDSLTPLLSQYYSRGINEWGCTLQAAGKLKEAGICFQRSTNTNPENLSARINSKVNERLADTPSIPIGAVPNLQNALGFRGGWPEALAANGPVDEPNFRVDLATKFASGGNHRQAVQNYHRAIEMSSEDLGLRLQLAQLLVLIESFPITLTPMLPYTNCYTEAITNADYILSFSTNNPGALFTKSLSQMQMKDYESAVATFSKFLEGNPDNPAAHLDRAIAYLQLEKMDEAAADYNSVIKASATAYAAYYGLAEIAYKQKKNDVALANYELYLKNAPAGTDEAKQVEKRVQELKSAAP